MDEAELTRQVKKNIALAEALLSKRETPEVIGIVCGSSTAQEFWQTSLDESRSAFGAREAVAFNEDLPTNQAFGLLLLWQRLKEHIQENRGALIAFVFGDGTRSTPFTETDNAQKPAMATFVRTGSRFIPMVELAMKYFVPVQQYLRRSGFKGLVVKWGDEVQIPTLDLTGANDLFRDADVVRFVSLREIEADEAKNKDWVGVDGEGRVTAFIPRRPISQMEALADRGLVRRRDGKLFGGVNLGGIAVSYTFLDCLLEEFRGEVNDATADRRNRPALDPEFFTALTIAVMDDPAARARAWDSALRESADMQALSRHFPDLLRRLRRAIRPHNLKIVAMDFGDQYWGDIGQHAKIYEFYIALNRPGPVGRIALALAGLPETRDAAGNIIVNSEVSPQIEVKNSVLVNAILKGKGRVEGSVLIGTRAGNIEIEDGFDVLSTVTDLHIGPRGGTYKVVSSEPVHAATGERLTTLFLDELGPRLFRVHEDTDLRDKPRTYSVPILGNPLSFEEAHRQMARVSVRYLAEQRHGLESKLWH
jgi:hypothetical protein